MGQQFFSLGFASRTMFDLEQGFTCIHQRNCRQLMLRLSLVFIL
jgi:hypothetical protein